MTSATRSVNGSMPVVGGDLTEHIGAVHVVAGEVGQGAEAPVPQMDASLSRGGRRIGGRASARPSWAGVCGGEG
jgi:hypothetical protein